MMSLTKNNAPPRFRLVEVLIYRRNAPPLSDNTEPGAGLGAGISPFFDADLRKSRGEFQLFFFEVAPPR